EERIMGNVYAKGGSEQGVVHRAFRAIVQGEKQLLALGNCRGHHTRGGNANGLTPRVEPRRPRRPDGALSPAILNRSRDAAEQMRTCYELAEPGLPYVRDRKSTRLNSSHVA